MEYSRLPALQTLSSTKIVFRARGVAPLTWPTDVVAGNLGSYIFAAKNCLGILRPGGTILKVPLTHTPQMLCRGFDTNYWFAMPDGDEIGRVSADGTLQAAIAAPPRSRPSTVSGSIGQIFVGLNGPHALLRFDGSTTAVNVPLSGFATTLSYGPDQLVWYATQDGLRSVVRDGSTPGPSLDLPDCAIVEMTFDWTADQLWYADPARDVIGSIRRDRVTEILLDPDTRPEAIIMGLSGVLWFVTRGGKRIAMIKGDRVTEFPVDGLGDSVVTKLLPEADGTLVCTDRWNNLIGFSQYPAIDMSS